jgi:hypothetical protein
MKTQDISSLVARLKAQQRDIEALLHNTADDDAHHLRCALEALKTAISSIKARFADGHDGHPPSTTPITAARTKCDVH